jgi:hypothetical protein
MQRLAWHSERAGEVAGADEEPIDLGDGDNGFDTIDSFQSFDLNG